MRTKHITYTVWLVLMLLVPIARYYSSTPDINACVLDYVENLEESNYKWYMYDINGIKHIEPWNSNLNESLKEYKIWKAYWCLMVWNNLFNDLNNTFYCTVTYLIKNSPLPEKYKEPLWILKTE